MHNFNQKGLELIKSFEKCVLTAYPDPVSKGEPYTIGWGHTGGVTPGQTISQDKADAFLVTDIGKTIRAIGGKILIPVTDNEFSAMVCLAFNIGAGNFSNSHLLRCLNNEQLQDAANEFLKWDHVNGQKIPGLTRRREAEQLLFLTPDE